jgi:hypothetical protein
MQCSLCSSRRVAKCAVLVVGLLGMMATSAAAQFRAEGPGAPEPDRAAVPAAAETWRALGAMPAAVMAGQPWIRPDRFGSFALQTAAMRGALAKAPMEFSPEAANPAVIEIPLPDGTLGLFQCVESPIMAPELQAQFPDIRTYLVWSAQDRSINGRIDLTPLGFHAMIFTTEGTIFVDPVTRNDAVHHASYFRDDLRSTKDWHCDFDPKIHDLKNFVPDDQQGVVGSSGAINAPGDTEASGAQLRTYRLAMACTGEYYAFYGTVNAARAGMTTTVNRVVGVYEKEVAIRMTVVTNLIYTDASNDPYTNSDGSAMLDQNINAMSAAIGNSNFDIGHVVSTGGGGIARLGVVCRSQKAGGVTGSSNPVGDPFDIDYVSHEMGHQFGGRHSFNSTIANCGQDNRDGPVAYEIGSGTTIMAYAGICGADNVQPNSDPYFHFAGYDNIIAYSTINGGNNCPSIINTFNNPPTVSAGAAYTIPVNTRFTLTATGSDPDGDSLTYCWEQRDLGPATTITDNDNGSSPIFRSRPPTTSTSRTFPATTDASGLVPAVGERFPITSRTMNFRVTARDNNPGGGGVNTDETTVTTVAGTAFAVTSPNTAVTWPGGSVQTITWSNTGTAAAPINTANVRIRYSTDGGATFPTILANSAPNSGLAVVIIPNPASTVNTARIRVEAIGNIYFDVSNANFTVTRSIAPSAPTNVIATPSSICSGNSTTLSGTVSSGNSIVWYTDGCGTNYVGVGNSITVSPSVTTVYYARASNNSSGLVSATCTPITVTVLPNPVAPTGTSVNRSGFCAGDDGTITLTATGGSGSTLSWYTNSCGGTLVGTGNNLTIPSPTTSTTYFVRWSITCRNSTCAFLLVDVNTSDITLDGTIDFGDFLAFFNCYDVGDPCADVDGDPGIDFTDFLTFFNGYDQGC